MAARKPRKFEANQPIGRREPRQARALHKVGLILEAATRLVEERGLEALTTNAIAERAGVSIGTLYQYFDGKEAILDALARKEITAMGARVRAMIAGPPPAIRGGRIPMLLQAVLASYGGRRKTHRRLMEHAIASGGIRGSNPVFAQITEAIARDGIVGPGGERVKLTPARAFVLTHALAGVMRAMLVADGGLPPRQEIEAALVRLVLGYLQPGASGG